MSKDTEFIRGDLYKAETGEFWKDFMQHQGEFDRICAPPGFVAVYRNGCIMIADSFGEDYDDLPSACAIEIRNQKEVDKAIATICAAPDENQQSELESTIVRGWLASKVAGNGYQIKKDLDLNDIGCVRKVFFNFFYDYLVILNDYEIITNCDWSSLPSEVERYLLGPNLDRLYNEPSVKTGLKIPLPTE